MPCTLTGSREGDLEYWLQASRTEITQIAQLLCKACSLLDKNEVKLPKDLKTWWSKHQTIDAKRTGKKTGKQSKKTGKQSKKTGKQSKKR